MKTERWINRSAAALAVISIALGLGWSVLIRVDPGIRLGITTDNQVVITDVLPYSPASMQVVWSSGASGAIQPGAVVTSLNQTTLIQLPQNVYASPAPTPDPNTGIAPDPVIIGVDPATPTNVLSPDQLQTLIAQPISVLEAVSPADLAHWDPGTMYPVGLSLSTWDIYGAVFMLAAGILVMFLVAGWLATGRAGTSLQPLAMPAALAIGGPMVLWPVEAGWSAAGIAVYSVLMPFTLLPLAAALVARITTPTERTLAAAGAVACAAGAIAIGLARLAAPLGADQALPIMVLAGGITALPGLAAASSSRATVAAEGEGLASRRVVRGASYAVVGLTPMFAIATAIGPYAVALPIWITCIAVAGVLTVRPLARLAGRAQLQRDLVVAATEAERARVAADIHDDALQELTLLVRRLDAAGDTEGADMARGISDRLRAICGDLRLPILDDLGIGPALDWLVIRIERISGGEVRLERADGSRPPAEVELAFFRVAQEALSNAVKHGRPPIVIRYSSQDGFASLSIDDAGTGIDSAARATAEADGHHFGLLNMAQRAEAIGAILDVRRWPTGGTHVGLEWRAR